MKKSLIFLSILIVSFIAFFDAKDRIEELDEVAANTPSQVEMKQQIRPPVQQNMNNFQEDKKTDTEKLKQQMQQNNQNLPNNLDKIQERRNTITNPVN
ncbi:unknown [Clostridium sp. CAG:967]|nr:unknown [Clostridium sp. CAG:967]